MQGNVIAAEPIPAIFEALQQNVANHATKCEAEGKPL